MKLQTGLLIVFLFCISFFLSAQSAEEKLGLEVDKWAVKLSEGSLNEVNSLGSLTNQLMEADTLRARSFLDSLEASDNAKGYFFRTFFNMVKADYLYAKFASYEKYKDRKSKELQPIKEQMMKLYADALDAVYHTEIDLTIGWVCFYSARRMRLFGETGWAVMYSKNGVDLFEKVGYNVEPPVYTELADLLYQVREYDESIIYAKKGLAAWKKVVDVNDLKDRDKFWIRDLNTIGNAFYRKNQHDSAFSYYQQALRIAKEENDTFLTGKTLGNIGRILYAQNKFDSAYSLFKTDYQNSKDDSLYDNAANASEWAARANLARGNKVAALAEAREAINLLSLWPNGPYLRNTYYTLTQIFRAMGNYDSAFYYNDRYTALNDSLEKEVATSSLAISKAKLNDETSKYNIQTLNREKKAQLFQRNMIILGIVVLSIFAVSLINRKRLQSKYRAEKVEQEKLLMAQEMTSAKEQMQMFTQNIIEKTGLIEKLEHQVKSREASIEQQQLITELTNQTILTEEEWTKFKSLFEKIYPGFLINLKSKVNDITIAEQRMTALVKLQLTTNQIASILGISPNSVYKTKQRLRQRFALEGETSIEDFIARM